LSEWCGALFVCFFHGQSGKHIVFFLSHSETKKKNMVRKLRTIDLFSGCGGMALGLRPYTKTIAYCEINEAAQQTLRRNMESGGLDRGPIHPDVRTFPTLRTSVDMVTMGFPCQDVSKTGGQQGFRGERSCLFYDGMCVVRRHQPTFVLLENVANITTNQSVWSAVLTDLHDSGYDAKWCVLSALSCGAPHRRNRWFLLATKRGVAAATLASERVNASEIMAPVWNTEGWGTFRPNGWEVNAPRMSKLLGVVGDERVRQCGNICVPRQAVMAFRMLRFGVADQPNGQPHCETPTSKLFLGEHLPHWGEMYGDNSGHQVFVALPTPKLPRPASCQLLLVPKPKPGHELLGEGRSFRQRRASVTEPKKRHLWGTPRATSSRVPARTLTTRMMTDLRTQMRFEKDTVAGHTLQYVNPDYLDWMCGLPSGWTRPHGEAGIPVPKKTGRPRKRPVADKE